MYTFSLLSLALLVFSSAYAQEQSSEPTELHQNLYKSELLEDGGEHRFLPVPESEPTILEGKEDILKAGDEEKLPIVAQFGDVAVRMGGKFKVESFFNQNVALLNNKNSNGPNGLHIDEGYLTRHTIDLTFDMLYGKNKYGYDAVEFYFTMRNKGDWGNPASLGPTSAQTIKFGDIVGFDHRHFLGKHFFWIREIWFKVCLNAIFDLNLETRHYMTWGAFPFQLGRGIALGDAFLANPGLLGFYSENVVDQYAFGWRLSGELEENVLSYDLYAAMLKNDSLNIVTNAQRVREQWLSDCGVEESKGPGIQFDQGTTKPTQDGRKNPYRQFGDIDYILAARLLWTLFRHPTWGVITFEPYILFNSEPQQTIEVESDANSKLGTVGFATEWQGGRLQGGFDTAFNFGRQQVVSLDRNTIVLRTESDATFAQGYTHVVTEEPTSANPDPTKALATSDNKNIVNLAPRQVNLNGQNLTVNGQNTPLWNSLNRFRQGYENKYKGWMFVADAGYWYCPTEFMIAGTVGIASGDENPNESFDPSESFEKDGDYKGFIGLQEIYSGRLVESVFVLGVRKLPRPLSIPEESARSNRFASTINEFTNLVYGGVGLHWKPANSKRKLYLRPNVLFFGLETATKKFDFDTGKTIDEPASKFLGTEVNLILNLEWIPDFRWFFVGAVFVPGQHYCDIFGKPISREQQAFFDLRDKTGFSNEAIPLLGADPAWFMNFGFQYNF
jgi:hypothetical protein